MSESHTGHYADSGIQQHSCGDIWPYRIEQYGGIHQPGHLVAVDSRDPNNVSPEFEILGYFVDNAEVTERQSTESYFAAHRAAENWAREQLAKEAEERQERDRLASAA